MSQAARPPRLTTDGRTILWRRDADTESTDQFRE